MNSRAKRKRPEWCCTTGAEAVPILNQLPEQRQPPITTKVSPPTAKHVELYGSMTLAK